MNTNERRDIRAALIAAGFSRDGMPTQDFGDGAYNEFWVHKDGTRMTCEWAPKDGARRHDGWPSIPPGQRSQDRRVQAVNVQVTRR